MELIIWALIFVASIALVVKGADWFLDSSEKIGFAIGLSSFVVGVVIVGIGTSLPELVSALAAIVQGADELVVANAFGSNIANVLLIVGLSAAVGGRLAVSKNLIDLDIPLLTIVTAFGVIVALDAVVTPTEALFLVASFFVFLAYSTRNGRSTGDDPEEDDVQQLFSFKRRRPALEIHGFNDPQTQEQKKRKLEISDFVFLVVGLVALVVGGRYLVQSVVTIADLLSIGIGSLSLVAVAIGTSLPELAVSLKAATQGKHEVTLGNIFGSNVFNILLVIGLPGLFVPLRVDVDTLLIGMPFMVIATFFFIISSMSRRIHSYEGALYLLLYILFIGKLFGLF